MVGDYVADLLIEETVLVALTATGALAEVHRAQCMNDLKATGLHLCRLLSLF